MNELNGVLLCRNCFKPYYKWITFNTMENKKDGLMEVLNGVLNLIINGLPLILHFHNNALQRIALILF